MGLTVVVVVGALLIAAVSHLYTPLHPGYSASSKAQFQLSMAVKKLEEDLSSIGSFLGFGSKIDIQRKIHEYFTELEVESKEIVNHEAFFDGIKVRIYKLSEALNETLPGIIYFHGGGWVMGDIESVDKIVKQLCRTTRSVVVSTEYRLAPDFPFPAAIDDCTTATKYFMKNAADFNVDPNRIAVVGDSAGGNLAAAVPLRLRDEKFPIRLKLQVLLYPVIQGLDFNLPSLIQNGNSPFLTKSMVTFVTALYIEGNLDHLDAYSNNRHVIKSFHQSIAKTYMNVANLPEEFLSGYVQPEFPDGDEELWNKIKGKLLNPYYSPLTADNLEDLPDAYVFSANYCPLRDEAWLYAIQLKAAKNKVTVYNAEHGFHGMANYIGVIPEVDLAFKNVTTFIADNL